MLREDSTCHLLGICNVILIWQLQHPWPVAFLQICCSGLLVLDRLAGQRSPEACDLACSQKSCIWDLKSLMSQKFLNTLPRFKMLLSIFGGIGPIGNLESLTQNLKKDPWIILLQIWKAQQRCWPMTLSTRDDNPDFSDNCDTFSGSVIWDLRVYKSRRTFIVSKTAQWYQYALICCQSAANDLICLLPSPRFD